MQENRNSQPPVACPSCERGDLYPFGRLSMRCEACDGVLAGPVLRTLLDIVSLPEVGTPSANDASPPQLTGDGRSGWLDFYLTQYRRLLDPRQSPED
ncbi:hypothetical protein [Rubrobacter indicoceani]|uniref:hypothetical protein n=1 Tax=Rubrobacter indicoceani TaxID=2051957 RepID=UPI000E5BDAF3|nr:hypothetical protein [Rubrobacter indicoceani]